MELQTAALAALRADGGVASAFAALNARVRIYEVPPTNAPLPYVCLQSDSIVPLLAEGLDLAELEITPTVWTLSDPPNMADCMALGRAVLSCLLALDALPSWRVQQARSVRTLYSLDHDGRTAKAAIAVQFALDAL